MKKELRTILDDIDTFLSTGDSVDSFQLWNILAALRGPDSENSAFKAATTAVIRRHAFPKTAHMCDATGGRVCGLMTPDNDIHAAFRRDMTSSDSHFINHAKWAFSALDLVWKTTND